MNNSFGVLEISAVGLADCRCLDSVGWLQMEVDWFISIAQFRQEAYAVRGFASVSRSSDSSQAW